MPRLTLQDLADELGVSKATVSLALRGDPRIATATRTRVQSLAQRRDYRPDPALSTIARARWQDRTGSGAALAWLFATSGDQRHDADVMRQGAAMRASALGWNLRAFVLSAYRRPADCAAELTARGIRGVIFASLTSAQQLAGWPWAEFTMVACGMGRWLPPVDRIHRDVVGAGLTACRELAASGHRRIAAIPAGEPGSELGNHSRAGLLAGLLEAGSPVPLCPIDEDALPAIRTWLQRHRPTAVLLPNIACYRRLLAGGLIPNDMSVALLKRSPALRAPGIDPQHEDCGALAVDQVLGLLARHHRGVPTNVCDHLLSARWVA